MLTHLVFSSFFTIDLERVLVYQYLMKLLLEEDPFYRNRKLINMLNNSKLASSHTFLIHLILSIKKKKVNKIWLY